MQPDVVGPTAVRVCIVSAIRFYREGLARLLGTTDGVLVTDAVGPEVIALEGLVALAPEIALVDISGVDGLYAMHWLADHAEGIRVIALAVSELETDVYECATAGVAGYVTRDGSLADLVAILYSVSRGELRCPAPVSSILRRSLATLSPRQGTARTSSPLTTREMEILHLLTQRLSNKEIAHRLTIEVSTVKSHVHNIFEKLHLNRRGDATSEDLDLRRVAGSARGSLR